MNKNADYWIENLKLEAHIEGGYFKEIYRSVEVIKKEHLPDRYNGDRSFSTSIYFLLKGEQISKLHKLKSDEIWHFYTGSSLLIHIIDDEGKLNTIKLGNHFTLGEHFQYVVKAGCWFCAEVIDKSSYGLIGCTVSPGFDFSDFELANREKLLENFPEHKTIIEKFT